MIEWLYMKNGYFHAVLFIIIIIFGFLGYTSYTQLQFTFDQPTNTTDQISQQTDQPTDLPETIPGSSAVPTPTSDTEIKTDEPAVVKTIPEKYKKLGDKIQGLINDKVIMKPTSRGTRVGTVEEFMNAYDSANIKPTNSYSASLVTRVTSFQTAQGVTPASGLANPDTYTKMIDWLTQ